METSINAELLNFAWMFSESWKIIHGLLALEFMFRQDHCL